ncbi:hypothetical protein Lepto7375DRAFT_7245 [Leptolyngbya sp. PCC 7375]|nr:hypothetical protein Lepto7375DRAFT_7245 [Leptolyngbya sp. PCC 7375]
MSKIKSRHSVVKQYAKGCHSIKEVAKALGVTPPTLRKYIKTHNLQRNIQQAKNHYFSNLYPIGSLIGKNRILKYIPGCSPSWLVQCSCGSKPRILKKDRIDKKVGCYHCLKVFDIDDVSIPGWEITSRYMGFSGNGKTKVRATKVNAKCLSCNKTYVRQLHSLINQTIGGCIHCINSRNKSVPKDE